MSTMKVDSIVSSGGTNTAQINGITPALASQAEAEAGTDNTKLMTPLRVAQAIQTLNPDKMFAYIHYDQTTNIVHTSKNIQGITDLAVGWHRITFQNPAPNNRYVILTHVGIHAGTALGDVRVDPYTLDQTTDGFEIATIHANTAYYDYAHVSALVLIQ